MAPSNPQRRNNHRRNADSRSVPKRPLHVGLCGATLDTGNLGVSVLTLSTIRGLLQTGIPWTFTLFDERPGTRRRTIATGDWEIEARCVGCYISRRYYSPNNLQQCFLASRLGLGRVHPTVRNFQKLDAIIDISCGDSFSDLYGMRRFHSQVYPKLIALHQGTPLFLLPQTYGPFSTARNLAIAREIILGAKQAWSRDPHGIEIFRELLGADFDESRHRNCVDVGFGMQPREPEGEELRDNFLRLRESTPLLLGVNVSGLLWENPTASQRVFGLRESYRDIMLHLVERLTDIRDARVALFSHVCPVGDRPRLDAAACIQLHSLLAKRLSSTKSDCVTVIPHLDDPAQTWWMIGKCDWFSGARMHSCIGALSQGVPTAAMAYSHKALGVVETAGAGEWVLDPRTETAREMTDKALASIEERTNLRRAIEQALTSIRSTLDEQFREIAAGIVASANC